MEFNDTILFLKYAAAILIIAVIYVFPLYLARQNKASKDKITILQIYGFALGWTGIGWLAALWYAARK